MDAALPPLAIEPLGRTSARAPIRCPQGNTALTPADPAPARVPTNPADDHASRITHHAPRARPRSSGLGSATWPGVATVLARCCERVASVMLRWIFDGSSMVLRWIFDGSSMVLRWFFDGFRPFLPFDFRPWTLGFGPSARPRRHPRCQTRSTSPGGLSRQPASNRSAKEYRLSHIDACFVFLVMAGGRREPWRNHVAGNRMGMRGGAVF